MPFIVRVILVLIISNIFVFSATRSELVERRQRAATMFHDGILLVHARSTLDISADGFRQSFTISRVWPIQLAPCSL
jgi:hypothetical protein